MAYKALPDAHIIRQSYDFFPNTGKFIRLKVVVDCSKRRRDVERAKKWNATMAGTEAGSIDDHGYVRIGINGQYYYAHRLAWLLAYGREPNEQIDHINGDRSDNRICNLREVTPTQNSRNKVTKIRSASGFRGVYGPYKGKFRAGVKVHGRIKWLGSFENAEDAANARLCHDRLVGFTDRHMKAQ